MSFDFNAPVYVNEFTVRKNNWNWSEHYKIRTTVADREFYGNLLRESYEFTNRINSSIPKSFEEFGLEFGCLEVFRAIDYDYSTEAPTFEKIESIGVEYLLPLSKAVKKAKKEK
jgi:hypothetical protein